MPQIYFDSDGIPFSKEFEDSYYSKSDGLLEAREVFLNACGLPEAWQDCKNYTIAELGFGTGLNFIATLELWRKYRPPNAILHFITYEKFLLNKEDAQKAHANWPQISELSNLLIDNWPKNINGTQLINLEKEAVFLNINIGDAQSVMQSNDFLADAWFLDGFAPSRNPKMWSQEIFNEIKRLSAPWVRIGTYSSAGFVRQNMENAGFVWERKQGFGNKKHRLEAYINLENKRPRNNIKPRIAIIGGGIAGSAMMNALKLRGLNPQLIDNDKDGEYKASNNPAGLIMPRLDKFNTIEARFYKSAFLYAIQKLNYLDKECFRKETIEEIPKSEREKARINFFKDNMPLPQEFLEFDNDKIFHKMGGVLYPDKILSALQENCQKIYANITKIEQNTNQEFILFDGQSEIYIADIVIHANGTSLNKFIQNDLTLSGREGVISIANYNYPELYSKAGKAYCIGIDGKTLFGATFDHIKLEAIAKVKLTSHEKNIELLHETAPQLAQNIDINNLEGRASIRTVTKDCRPIIGNFECQNNQYILGALGARGFTIAFIGAEIIACKICNEPMPIENEILEFVSPKRYSLHKPNN